jgi:hypothetical protein
VQFLRSHVSVLLSVEGGRAAYSFARTSEALMMMTSSASSMNVLAARVLLVVLTGLFPPWERRLASEAGPILVVQDGHAPVFLPPHPHGSRGVYVTYNVAYRRLLIYWTTISVATIGALVLLCEPRRRLLLYVLQGDRDARLIVPGRRDDQEKEATEADHHRGGQQHPPLGRHLERHHQHDRGMCKARPRCEQDETAMRGRVPCRQEHETPSVASTAFNIGPAVQRGACRMLSTTAPIAVAKNNRPNNANTTVRTRSRLDPAAIGLLP